MTYPGTGTPPEGQVRRGSDRTWQGGVISPLLANVFLHEVVDMWFEHTVKPRLKGRARLVRYADDMVMVFATEDDARRVLAVLPGASAPDQRRAMKRPAHRHGLDAGSVQAHARSGAARSRALRARAQIEKRGTRRDGHRVPRNVIEDPAGGVQPAEGGPPAGRPSWPPSGHVRPPGLHPGTAGPPWRL